MVYERKGFIQGTLVLNYTFICLQPLQPDIIQNLEKLLLRHCTGKASVFILFFCRLFVCMLPTYQYLIMAEKERVVQFFLLCLVVRSNLWYDAVMIECKSFCIKVNILPQGLWVVCFSSFYISYNTNVECLILYHTKLKIFLFTKKVIFFRFNRAEHTFCSEFMHTWFEW